MQAVDEKLIINELWPKVSQANSEHEEITTSLIPSIEKNPLPFLHTAIDKMGGAFDEGKEYTIHNKTPHVGGR